MKKKPKRTKRLELRKIYRTLNGDLIHFTRKDNGNYRGEFLDGDYNKIGNPWSYSASGLWIGAEENHGHGFHIDWRSSGKKSKPKAKAKPVKTKTKKKRAIKKKPEVFIYKKAKAKYPWSGWVKVAA